MHLLLSLWCRSETGHCQNTDDTCVPFEVGQIGKLQACCFIVDGYNNRILKACQSSYTKETQGGVILSFFLTPSPFPGLSSLLLCLNHSCILSLRLFKPSSLPQINRCSRDRPHWWSLASKWWGRPEDQSFALQKRWNYDQSVTPTILKPVIATVDGAGMKFLSCFKQILNKMEVRVEPWSTCQWRAQGLFLLNTKWNHSLRKEQSHRKGVSPTPNPHGWYKGIPLLMVMNTIESSNRSI